MRRTARRRSTATLVIWSVAFATIAALMAWQFGWVDRDAAPQANARGDAQRDPNAPPEPMPYEPANVDQIVFSRQSEPEVIEEPFDRPGFSPPASPAAISFGGVSPNIISQPPEPDLLPDAGSVADGPAPLEPPLQPYTRSRAELPPESSVIPASNEEPASSEEPAATPIPTAADADLERIDALFTGGEYLEAHKALSKIYWNNPERRPEIQDRIDHTAQLIYFSPQPHLMPAYVVESGDLLSRIAAKYAVSWEYLARLNRVEPQRIQAGQRLKVIKGPFSAIVDLDRYELIVHAHGYYVRRYPVGIGKDHSTPVGTFSVKNKEFNPTYYGTDEETGLRFIVERDDPQNPLGERWIDLGDSYGIHGTIDPESIGKAESRGCIRMRNEDVEIVYDLLSLGSEVVIQRKSAALGIDR
jgi:LysM repeat protein